MRPVGGPPKLGASISASAACAGSMAMVRKSMPRASARASASVREWSEENRLGIDDAVHVLGPEGVDGDAGDERGVDAARQADHDVGEAVLA